MKTLFLICLAILFSLHGAAQSFTVRHYGMAEGMPSSEVYDVFQDSKGFIWFATDNGVVRFDGLEMKTYRAAEGLEDPVVFGITEDHRGRLFFRTFSGKLFIYENEQITPFPYNDIIASTGPSAIVISMHIDSADAVWFSTGQLWGRISSTGEAVIDSVPKHQMFYKTTGSGHLTGKRILHNTTAPYLNIDGEAFKVDYNIYEHHTMNHFAVKWRGKLYFTGNDRMFEYDGKAVKQVLKANSPIIALYKDPFDHLWIGYQSKGVERYKDNDLKEPWSPDFLDTRSVSNIMYDSEGGLWFSTLENGVFHVPDISIEQLAYTDSSKVKAILVTDKQVVIGTYSGTLTMMDAATESMVDRKEFSSPIKSLFQDSRNDIWVSANALIRFDSKFNERQRYLYINPVLDFAEDKEGNVHGFTSFSCYVFDRLGRHRSSRHSRKIGGLRNMLFADTAVFASGRLGLHLLDTTHTYLMSPPSLASLKISKLLRINDSTLLAGTIGSGIHLVHTRTWTSTSINSKNRFIADNVYTAVKTDTTVWLGTEKGILIVNIQSLLGSDPTFVHLTRSTGLITDKVNFIGLTRQAAWAFSDNGISVIPYATLGVERSKPKFYLKNLFLNERSVSIDENLELPHDAANMAISFGFLSTRDQDILSRYRLTKNDPWIYVRDRNLQLSSLGPDDYLFELEYSVDNFHWMPATSFEFAVNPPWWQRWYVQAGAFLVLALLVYLYIRSYYRRLHQQQQKLIQAEIETLERERNRIAKELHDGVATNLSAIKLMVSQLLRTHNDPLAEDVDEHFMHTITEIKDIIYGLTPPGLERHGLFMGLKNYIDKLNKTIPVRIHLDTAGNDINKSELGILTFRIIQELLSNAVKHASAKNIFITMNSENNQLSILFKDDGIGFSYDPGKTGLGLANVESRVESVNGNMKFESRTTGVTGSSYTINLPLN